MTYVTAEIKHRCGHTAVRQLRSYDPFRRTTSPIREMEHLDPPKFLLEAHRKSVRRATAYVRRQLCPPCYRARQEAQ